MVDKNNSRMFLNNLNIKTRIGSILFNIMLDPSFFDIYDGFNVENHNHPACEVHYVVKGSASIEVNGKSHHIRQNSYYIIGPGVYHEQKVDPENLIGKYCFKMDYKLLGVEEDFFPAEENKQIAEVLKSIVFFSAEDDIHDNLSLIYEIQNELQSRRIGYYSKIQSLFSQLILNIIRDIASKQESTYSIPERLSHEKRSLMIEDFFEYNYNKNVASSDLAGLLHVSVRQLNRILADIFNMSFKQKLIEKRMEISKSLLRNTDLPVKAISEKVGYDTESNFSTIFKQKTGFTPNEYRHGSKASHPGAGLK